MRLALLIILAFLWIYVEKDCIARRIWLAQLSDALATAEQR